MKSKNMASEYYTGLEKCGKRKKERKNIIDSAVYFAITINRTVIRTNVAPGSAQCDSITINLTKYGKKRIGKAKIVSFFVPSLP